MPYQTITCYAIPYHIISYHSIPYHCTWCSLYIGSVDLRARFRDWRSSREKSSLELIVAWKGRRIGNTSPPRLFFFTFKMVMILELAFCRKTCPNLIIYAETLYFLKFNSRDGWKPIRDRKKAKSKESWKTEEKSKAYTGKPIRDGKNIKSKEFWKQKRNLKHLLPCLLSEFEGFLFNW